MASVELLHGVNGISPALDISIVNVYEGSKEYAIRQQNTLYAVYHQESGGTSKYADARPEQDKSTEKKSRIY